MLIMGTSPNVGDEYLVRAIILVHGNLLGSRTETWGGAADFAAGFAAHGQAGKRDNDCRALETIDQHDMFMYSCLLFRSGHRDLHICHI